MLLGIYLAIGLMIGVTIKDKTHTCPEYIVTVPTIIGVGYETICGQGPGRTFFDGKEMPVEDCQELLGCDKVEGVVGPEVVGKMRKLNKLTVYEAR
jgi:hypothetical protein